MNNRTDKSHREKEAGAAGIWISVGLSLALIATGIAFIYVRHADILDGGRGWLTNGGPHGAHMGPMGALGMSAGAMGIVLVLFWIILILAGISLLSGLINRRKTSACQPPPNALEILKRRYARGEIDRVEFEDRRKRLLES